jgi:hypothetical protein
LTAHEKEETVGKLIKRHETDLFEKTETQGGMYLFQFEEL